MRGALRRTRGCSYATTRVKPRSTRRMKVGVAGGRRGRVFAGERRLRGGAFHREDRNSCRVGADFGPPFSLARRALPCFLAALAVLVPAPPFCARPRGPARADGGAERPQPSADGLLRRLRLPAANLKPPPKGQAGDRVFWRGIQAAAAERAPLRPRPAAEGDVLVAVDGGERRLEGDQSPEVYLPGGQSLCWEGQPFQRWNYSAPMAQVHCTAL